VLGSRDKQRAYRDLSAVGSPTSAVGTAPRRTTQVAPTCPAREGAARYSGWRDVVLGSYSAGCCCKASSPVASLTTHGAATGLGGTLVGRLGRPASFTRCFERECSRSFFDYGACLIAGSHVHEWGFSGAVAVAMGCGCGL